MAKVVLSVGPHAVAAIRRCSGGAIQLRLLLPPTITNNHYSSSSSSPSYYRTLLPTLGLDLNPPGRRRRLVVAAPIAMISTTKSEPHRRRSIRASSSTHHHHHEVNDSGSIDSPLINSMQTKIKEQLNAESVIVKDAYGDGRHVSIDVVSSVFEGESAVSRQRMVYKAIWEELQNTVHAVDQMTTKTPSEAATNK